jgi:hypothetical protein
MDSSCRLNKISEEVLKDLVDCYFTKESYFMNSRLGRILEEDDNLFITNEEIIENIKRKLASKFYLDVTTVRRLFKSQNIGLDDLYYEDTELEIRQKKDDD